MRLNKPCLWLDADGPCTEVSPDTYCRTHRPVVEKRRHNPLYDDARWRRLRTRTRAKHIAKHGFMCPGWNVEPHLAADLDTDHVVPVALGGEPYSESNVQILCGECNERKGTASGRATGWGPPR